MLSISITSIGQKKADYGSKIVYDTLVVYDTVYASRPKSSFIKQLSSDSCKLVKVPNKSTSTPFTKTLPLPILDLKIVNPIFNYQRKLSFGLGLNIFNVNAKVNIPSLVKSSYSNSIGYGLNAQAEYKISRIFSIESGIGFAIISPISSLVVDDYYWIVENDTFATDYSDNELSLLYHYKIQLPVKLFFNHDYFSASIGTSLNYINPLNSTTKNQVGISYTAGLRSKEIFKFKVGFDYEYSPSRSYEIKIFSKDNYMIYNDVYTLFWRLSSASFSLSYRFY